MADKAQTGTVDIKLSTPIKIDGTETSVLRMREPKVRDQLTVDHIQGDAMKEITLLANLCDVAPDNIQDLSMRDYAKVQKAYQGFIV